MVTSTSTRDQREHDQAQRPADARAACGRGPARRAAASADRRSARRSRRSRRRTPSCTTLRLTFSDGVSSPVASVKSPGRIRNTLIASALDTAWLASSIAAWISARSRRRRAGRRRSRRRACRCRPARPASASSSMVTSAAMNGCRSPTTMHWLTSGWARTRSSSTAGATFLPPAVTMISFLRPVIVRKPSSSSCAEVAGVEPAVGVERLGGRVRVVPVAAEDDVAVDQDLAVVGDPDRHAGQRPADRADPDARPAG